MLDQLILQVVTLRGPSAVVVCVIMLGYALKMVPRFPNKFIPLASFITGPALTLVLVGPPNVGDMPHNLLWPDIAIWVSLLVTGFLLSCVAWIMHAQFLRKLIDDKVPALNPGRTTQRTQSSEVVTDSGGDVAVAEVTEQRTTDVKPADKTS